jgi:hypothetical protein
MKLCRLIYYSKSALRVSGDVSARHEEHLTIYSIWYYSPISLPAGVLDELKLIQDISRQQLGSKLPDTVKCSWWWAKTSPETCRADLE